MSLLGSVLCGIALFVVVSIESDFSDVVEVGVSKGFLSVDSIVRCCFSTDAGASGPGVSSLVPRF